MITWTVRYRRLARNMPVFKYFLPHWGIRMLKQFSFNENDDMSVLKLHSNHFHNGRDVRYTMRVTGVHNDSLERQVTEAVNIANFRGPALMNRRGELGGVRIERQQYRRWGANN